MFLLSGILKLKKLKILTALLIIVFSVVYIIKSKTDFADFEKNQNESLYANTEFKATGKAMTDAANIDIQSHNTKTPVNWTDIITYLACKYDNDFSKYKPEDADYFTYLVKSGEKPNEICKKYKNYFIYNLLYTESLDGLIGETASNGNSETVNYEKYGIKAYMPVAADYTFSHSPKTDDKSDVINVSGSVPVIAAESGYAESVTDSGQTHILRIKTKDSKRSLVYGNIKKENTVAEGDFVSAGDIIGHTYAGSNKENKSFLKFEIFINNGSLNEKQINAYEITEFLSVRKITEAKVKNKIKLPVIMYHGFTSAGNATQYVLSVSDFEQDMRYLSDNGFTAISSEELLQYFKFGMSLPEKPVMITFDDGYLNNLVFAYPIIKKYNVKVMISPIVSMVDFYSNTEDRNPLYAHLTWKDITDITGDGLVEIQNHSYDMHKNNSERFGTFKKKNESVHEYIKVFYDDMSKADKEITEHTGKKPVAYVYPFGNISKESTAVLKCCGYNMSFGCSEGYNYLDENTRSLFNLKRFNRTPKKSVRSILNNY